jgi:hypothetical protein
MTNDHDKLEQMKQFDFWLGEWGVAWGEDQHGTNRVVRILDGAVIQENFDGAPAIDFKGMSLSVYNPREKLWQQTWVDSQGNFWNFIGEFKDGQMVLGTDDVSDGKPVKLRMCFYNIQENELDWDWERSDDGGQTWQLRWRIHYTRKG